MPEQMTKAKLIDLIRTEWVRWERALERVPAGKMEQPYTPDGWTLKDVIAHLTWYEEQMVLVVSERAMVGSEWWALPLDDRNATIYAANRDRLLPHVLGAAQQVHAALIASLETLEDNEVNDARRFRDMPVDWSPWQVIASNTYEHYPAHIAQLDAWLTSAGIQQP